MRFRSRQCLAILLATLVYAAAVAASASASRLSISNTRFRATWASLTLEPTGVACAVTLEGSFHSATMRKTLEALIGSVTRGVIKNETCTNGRVTILQEQLPWHVRYGGFGGTLPNITFIRLRLAGAASRIAISFFEVACLLRTTAETPFVADAVIEAPGSGQITGLVPRTELTSIPFTGLCAFLGNATYGGAEGRLLLLGNTTLLTVRLI